MWNVKIEGTAGGCDGDVVATVDRVDAKDEVEAAVRASGAVAGVWKDFGGATGSARDAGDETNVPARVTDPADLPTWRVQVVLLVPLVRTSVRVLVTVEARREDAAVAAACARIGRALAVKLESVEFVEVRATELAPAPQLQLFRSPPETWPAPQVPPGSSTAATCECGHLYDRHVAAVDAEKVDGTAGRCEACDLQHRVDKNQPVCACFASRDPKAWAREHGRPVSSVEVVGAAEPAKPRRSRRARAAGKDAAAGEKTDAAGPDEAA